MSQNIGWIKLHRNLRNSFSKDKKLNIELWILYVFLAEQSAWDDYGELKRGQIKIKAVDIQNEIFPNMYLKRIRHLIAVLRKLGHIKTNAADHDNKDGLIYEVCQYDTFSGELPQKQVRQCLDSSSTVLRQFTLDNEAESLTKNHVELTGLDSAWTVLGQHWESPMCSYYIEERIKEEKEVKEEFKEGKFSSGDETPKVSNSLSIIKNEPKKLRKNTHEKDKVNAQPVIEAYHEAYLKRYGVKPIINGMTIKHAKQLIERLEGIDKSIAIVRFYLTHNNSFYLKNAHAFKFCLNDCEKLHTEFMKDNYIFNKDAKKVEDATANSILLEQLLARNRKERNE
jgi:hypothetical protein